MWANGFVPAVYSSETFCRLVDMHPSKYNDLKILIACEEFYFKDTNDCS